MSEQRTGSDGTHQGDGQPPSRFGRKKQEIVVAAVLLIGFLYLRINLVEHVRGRRGAAYLDPDFWPGWLLNVGILLALVYLVLAVMRLRRAGDPDLPAAPRKPVEDAEEDHHHDVKLSGNPVALLIGFLLLFGYIWGMTRIGFVPATLLFSAAFLFFVGERRWYVISAVPVVLLGLMLYVFTRLLVVPLPRGRGFFVELSTFFY